MSVLMHILPTCWTLSLLLLLSGSYFSIRAQSLCTTLTRIVDDAENGFASLITERERNQQSADDTELVLFGYSDMKIREGEWECSVFGSGDRNYAAFECNGYPTENESASTVFRELSAGATTCFASHPPVQLKDRILLPLDPHFQFDV